MSQKITPEMLDALCDYDTPTICNALEIVTPERRAYGYTTSQVVTADPSMRPICGYARTATIRAVDKPGPKAKQVRMGYYEHVAEGDVPKIVVIQDIDPQPGYGAFWGEVQSNVHKGLGCLGGLTNGSIRDLDVLAEGFFLLGGEVGPSHAWVHVVEYGIPVNIFGMAVCDGDIIHADRHGAVVIPEHAVAEIPATVELLTRKEAVILEAAKRPGFGIQDLRDAFAKQDDIH